MEKSIESIWKEGFLDHNALVAPKLNNLYNQKSQLTIEKLKSAAKKDQLSLIPVTVLFLLTFGYLGYYALSIYGTTLMIALFFLNRKKLVTLNQVDTNNSPYNYLLLYKKGIKKLISFYTFLLGVGTPLIIIPAYWLYFRDNAVYQKLITDNETLNIILLIICLALFLAAMGIILYRLTTKIVYGSLIKKIDELIADMEEISE
jgi:hypothetical protein